MIHYFALMRKAILIIGIIIALLFIAFAVLPGLGDTNGGDEGGNGGQSSSMSSVMTSSRSGGTQSSGPIGRELSCGDNVDNEGDALVDCDDPDCAGSGECRCSVLSCGSATVPGSSATCAREEGCICDDQFGCIACRQQNQTCDTSADCCYGLSLECGEVFLASGVREKRCVPTQRQVCTIRCEGNADLGSGIWSRPENCGQRETPPDAADCATLQGSCDLSQIEDRNTRECWRS